MKWLPILAYLFANVCLVTKSKEVILVLTEERKKKNIWVIPGGELWYRTLESFKAAVIREAGKEEMGIKLNFRRIKIFDAQIGYPTKGSPYEEKGITSVIVSYLYFRFNSLFGRMIWSIFKYFAYCFVPFGITHSTVNSQ